MMCVYGGGARPSGRLSLALATAMLLQLALLSPARGEGQDDADRYYRIGNWRKAASAYSQVLERSPSSENYLRAAEAAYHLGRLQEAERLAQQAGSGDVRPRILRALISARRGSPAAALRELESLTVDSADEHRVLTALGIIRRMDDEQQALALLYRAAEKDPDDFWAWFTIGLIHEDDENFEPATKAYKNAVRINPEFAQAQNNLGYAYKERHFYAYAVEHYRKAIELMPENPGYHYNIGNALSHQEKIDEAFAAYRKAAELEPTFAKAHYNLARTYLRKDMVTEAIAEFRLYLKYGTREVFGYVAPRAAVEDEIEQLEVYLSKYGSGVQPAQGKMAR